MAMIETGPEAFPGAKDYHRAAAPALPRSDLENRGFLGPPPPRDRHGGLVRLRVSPQGNPWPQIAACPLSRTPVGGLLERQSKKDPEDMVLEIFFAAMAAAAPVEDQVRCAELAFSRSVEQRNIEAFTAFVDEDARFTGGQTLRGKQEVSEAWGVFFTADGPTIRWAPDNIEVLDSGDLALSQGPFEMRVVDEQGQERVSTGRFFSVWRRDAGGRWTVVFDGGTPARPASGDPFADLDYDPAAVCENDPK